MGGLSLNLNSSNLKTKLNKVDRSKFNIKSPLNEILVGILLGDGHVQKRSLNGNSRFMYGQSSLRIHNLNYFKHVLNLFKPYLSETFKLKEKTFKDNRTNNTYKSVNFSTLSLPCFNQYKSLFYKNNKKIVPINIQELLTPIGLAYWIMDDGSIQNKGLHLNTYAFNSEDVLKLKSTALASRILKVGRKSVWK